MLLRVIAFLLDILIFPRELVTFPFNHVMFPHDHMRVLSLSLCSLATNAFPRDHVPSWRYQEGHTKNCEDCKILWGNAIITRECGHCEGTWSWYENAFFLWDTHFSVRDCKFSRGNTFFFARINEKISFFYCQCPLRSSILFHSDILS